MTQEEYYYNKAIDQAMNDVENARGIMYDLGYTSEEDMFQGQLEYIVLNTFTPDQYNDNNIPF